MANFPGDTSLSGGPPDLRASDADRERVSEVLRRAAGEGRLTLDELDERLGAAYAAKTYAELEPIVRDLPSAGDSAAVPATGYRFGASATSRLALSIMCGFARAGQWVVPRNFTAIAIMGGGALDLREAAFAERQVTIRAFALMGGIEVTVPEDAEVHVHGIGLMGGVGSPRTSEGRPGAPRIVVQGLALMGGINVRRRPPRGEGRRGSQSERHREHRREGLEDDGPPEIGTREHHSREHRRSEGGWSEGGGRSESGTDEA